MRKRWTNLSSGEIENHPLNGVRGWLAFFAFSIIVGFLRELAEVNASAINAGMTIQNLLSLNQPFARAVKSALLIQFFAVVAILYLLFSRSGYFRKATSALLVLTYPVIVVIFLSSPFEGMAEGLAQGLVGWVLGCVVWVSYLNLSRRVRVTFEGMDIQQMPHQTIAASGTGADHPRVDSEEADEPLFASAAAEVGSDTVDQGLWHRLLVENGGDENATRLRYIAIRARRLKEGTSKTPLRQPSDLADVLSREKQSVPTLTNVGLLNHPPHFKIEPRSTQKSIGGKIFAVSSVLVGLTILMLAFRSYNSPRTENAGAPPGASSDSTVGEAPGEPDEPGTISNASEADFMKRFPEWATPERRALLQERINKIDLERQANGQEPLSDTSVLEQARMQLVDEGHR